MSDETEMDWVFPAKSAFPVGEYGGMSLSDYFAAAALQGLISHLGWEPCATNEHIDTTAGESISNSAYQYADAMLKQRLTPTPE